MDNNINENNFNFEKGLIIFLDIDYLLNLKIFSEEFSLILLNFKNMTADIFSCHNFFEDFPKKTFLFEIFEKFQFFDEKTQFDSLENLLKSIKEFVNLKLENKEYSQFEVYTSLLILLYLFMQENIYGPSFFFIRETEKTDFKKELDKFNLNKFFTLEEKSKNFKEHMIEYLTVEGESPYKVIKLLLFYLICYELIVKSELFENLEINKLYIARILFMHNKIIKEPVYSLKENIFSNLNSFKLNSNMENYELTLSLLNLEQSYYNLRYFKYNESEKKIEETKNLLNLKMELTGRLGRKTKYQTFDSAILVLESESSTLEKQINNLKIEENLNELPISIPLEEESIM